MTDIYKDLFDHIIEKLDNFPENESLINLANKRIFPISKNEEFDEYLDDINSKIDIGGTEYDFSEVLYYTDNKSYGEQLEEYKSEKEKKSIENILNKYPTPISLLFEKYQNASGNKKLMLLKDINEVIIFLLYGIVVAELLRLEVDLHTFHGIKGKSKQLFDWKIETKIAIMTGAVNFFIANHGYSIIEDLYSTDTLDLCEKLNKFRNDGFHSFTLEEDKAEKLVRQYEPLLFDLLYSIHNIVDGKIFSLISDCSSPVLSYFGKETTEEEIEELSGVSRGILYFHYKGINLKLSPFLIFDIDNQKQLCFLKKYISSDEKMKYGLLSEDIDPDDGKWIFELGQDQFQTDIYKIEKSLEEKATLSPPISISSNVSDNSPIYLGDLDEKEKEIKKYLSSYVGQNIDPIAKNIGIIMNNNIVTDWTKRDDIISNIKVKIKKHLVKNNIQLDKLDDFLQFLIKIYS